MLSKRFGENLFDEMFDDPFELMPMFSCHNPRMENMQRL